MEKPVELTVEVLSQLEAKAKAVLEKPHGTSVIFSFSQAEFELIRAANASVILAMTSQITFLHTLLFGDMLPPDNPVFHADELDAEVKKLRIANERLQGELDAYKRLERNRWESAAKALGIKQGADHEVQRDQS